MVNERPQLEITKWLHLDWRGGDPWVLPIYSEVNNAVSRGTCTKLSGVTCEMGRHISLKLEMIPRIIRRINPETQELLEATKGYAHKYIFTPNQEGYAFPVDNDLKFNLIADIESYLFQVNACWDMMKKFMCQLYNHAGHQRTKGEIIVIINETHKSAKLPVEWIRLLDRERNFIAHQGAGYLAIDISKEEQMELLIMKTNGIKFNNHKQYFTFSDLIKINDGFIGTKKVMQDHLKSVVNAKS